MDGIILKGIGFAHNISHEIPGNPEHYPHTHSFCELYFYICGKSCFIVESGVYEPGIGTVILTHPGELHGVRIEEECSYERYFLHIEPQLMHNLGFPALLRCFYSRPAALQNALVMPYDTLQTCLQLLKKIETLLCEDSADAHPLAFAACLELLHQVNLCIDTPLQAKGNQVRSPLVNQVMQYLSEHLSEIHTADELAHALHFRREYISRQFTKHMGIPLNRFITLKRISQAKLLLETGNSLMDVCEACGWQNYEYFITVFHREVGITPFKYQEQYREYGIIE